MSRRFSPTLTAVVALAVTVLALAGAPSLAAELDQGRASYEKCAACHALDESVNTTGPSLKGLFGRKAGSRDDYRYSVAMQRSDVIWSASTLDQYLADPQAFMKGNRMPFAGIADPQERAALIGFLQQATK